MAPSPSVHRLRLDIQGAVQGVGFRPHVYRKARGLGLTGWIVNDHQGIRIEVEGAREGVAAFAEALRLDPPRQARITRIEEQWIPSEGDRDFLIRESRAGGTPTASILPDLATCPSCLADIRRAGDRRRGYPFTNCTDCGPRFSIVVRLPYDRPHTTMAGFVQCDACLGEYSSPGDRRFHAQPNACPACGPRLDWWPGNANEEEVADSRVPGSAGSPVVGKTTRPGPVSPDGEDEGALHRAARALGAGRVVAVQGLGGFHLMVDAASEAAVDRLRARKRREAKPLAVMVRDLAEARTLVWAGPVARELLTSPAAPIVLLRRRPDAPVAHSVAPGNPRIGVMLAATPLHHLLLERFGRPVVATSGNRSEEPICTTPEEARARLAGIADDFLVHDRPIRRHVDDSVTRPGPEGPQILRRARGYAPLPLPLALANRPVLAVGGHLKNTVAVARDGQVWLSQHIGDLETPEARRAFRSTVADFLELYRVEPEAVVHDLHPEYASTRFAREEFASWMPRIPVQHHHAHLAAALAEHAAAPDHRVLGVIWDGTGLGTDGTVWGGEFLAGGLQDAERVGHLRPFRLPGGEAAAREPRRSALSLLAEAGLLDHPAASATRAALTGQETRVLLQAVERGLNSPITTSAGRLFDALSSLLGLCQRSRFEGEAAMALEHAADLGRTDHRGGAYPMEVHTAEGGVRVLDWRPLLETMLEDRDRGVPVPLCAARAHDGLVAGIATMARAVGLESVVLSGGCFLNDILARGTHAALNRGGHRVLLHREVPTGDGGIALGQVAVAAARLAAGTVALPDDLPLSTGV
ncbi:MAG: carbamoyltransferase HypF [Gemmatimonadota bacterium]